MKYEIVSLKRTCLACPSQWEGKTRDNREVYIRYRHGQLDLWVSEPDEEFTFDTGTLVLSTQCGEEFHGVMDIAGLQKAVAEELKSGEDEILFPRPDKIDDDETLLTLGYTMNKAATALMEAITDGTIIIADAEKEAELREDGKTVLVSDDKFLNKDWDMTTSQPVMNSEEFISQIARSQALGDTAGLLSRALEKSEESEDE